MKRSEMLKVIEETINSSCGNDGEKTLYPPDSYLAYRILQEIEKVGMLSPGKNILFEGSPNELKYFKTFKVFFSWEPEDETK